MLVGRADYIRTALLLYDYLIALDKEVELFWSWKWTRATVLFMVNRYLVMILRLANLVGFVPMSDQVRRHAHTSTHLPHHIIQRYSWPIILSTSRAPDGMSLGVRSP